MDQVDKRIKQLFMGGGSSAQIAAEMGMQLEQVQARLDKLGMYVGNPAPDVTGRREKRSRQEELTRRRAKLEMKLLADAAKIRARLWEDVPIRKIDRFGDLHEYWVKPSPGDQKTIIDTVAAAINASARISEMDSGNRAAVVNLILSTADALGLDADGD